MANPGAPAVIVVGGDALALSIADELCALQGHRVVILWFPDEDFARASAATGAAFVGARPDSPEGLERAEVREAVTILAVSPDDQLNLHAALLARDANPALRIVLRQFNRTLAHKIEQNLPDCSVLSLAWHSAATYAAAALDPSCFRGLKFPEFGGALTGFAERIAGECEVDGLTVGEAEIALGMRVLALDGETRPEREAALAASTRLVVYGDVSRLQGTAPGPASVRERGRWRRSIGALWRWHRRLRHRLNPILVRLGIAAAIVFLAAMWHFHGAVGKTWLDAAYFVMTTMTTTGYGDLTPNRHSPIDIAAAMILMLAGITLTGLFIAFGASLLTRVHWVALQGLRPVHRRGHIVVCGAGSIGSEVIDLLLEARKKLVVVEAAPDTALVERARERNFDLLTGDASRDATLDLCNLEAAHGLVALTNVDTLNLEIALGARARNPTMPIALRIADASFAVSIARHFGFETTFSAAALAAPAFVGLSRFAGSRGRVVFAGREFAVGEITIGDDPRPSLPEDAMPLATARGEDFAIASDFDDLNAGDRLLIIVPLAPFKEGKDTFAAAAERFLRRA